MVVKTPKSLRIDKSTVRSKGISKKPGKSDTRLGELKHEFKPTRCEFEHLFDNARDAIRVINEDFTIRRINRTFAEMTGADQDDVIGKKCWEVFPGPFCHTPDCRLRRILNGEEKVQAEIERHRKDGTPIPCIVTAVPLHMEDGKCIGIIETFSDITESKQLRAQVTESEERYRALVELGTEVGEAIVMLQDIGGKEDIQTFVSDQWLHITGYTKEKLLGTCFFDLVSDKDREFSIERHRQKMSGKSVPGLFEMQIIRKDGMKVDIEFTEAPTVYRGNLANVAYIKDITDRKWFEHKIQESEELYRDLFQNVPIAILESDFSEIKKYYEQLRASGVTDFRELFFTSAPDELLNCEARLRVTRINKQAMKLFELSSGEQFVNELLQKHRAHLGSDEGPRECHIGLASGKTHFDFDDLYQTAKGNKMQVHTWVSVAPGYENSLSKVYVCFIDISARKKAESELIGYKDHLEDLVKERTIELDTSRKELQQQIEQRIQFTRAVVHELKTPLTPLLGANELLRAHITEEPWAKLAQQSYNGALELNERIDDLFDLTRNEMGTLKLNCTLTDPKEMVQQLINTVSPQCHTSGHEFSLDMPDSLPAVYCDPQRLKQVLNNLIDNACKYTLPGTKITLHIKVEDGKLVFQVEDSGQGIPENLLSGIFTPYPKLNGQKEHFGGLGLGLSICKTFVNLHGGEISATSKSGEGTCFLFFIPINGKFGS